LLTEQVRQEQVGSVGRTCIEFDVITGESESDNQLGEFPGTSEGKMDPHASVG
jgi:hypothetical protein